MVNIKSYCDIGRAVSSVGGTNVIGAQTHGHSSLTREGRRGGQQNHTHQPTIESFAA